MPAGRLTECVKWLAGWLADWLAWGGTIIRARRSAMVMFEVLTGESLRLVTEPRWSQFASACQRL
jgi:hypothetical protein